MAESTMKAPKRRIDPVRWARENLFSSWHNTILTLLVGYLIVTSVGLAQLGIAGCELPGQRPE